MPPIRKDITFQSDGLTLEGALHLPPRAPDATARFPGVVICHPHPRYGGDMYNVIVATLADSLCAAGIAALRFNFRGVDLSEGAFDGGAGEIRDAQKALECLSLTDTVDASRIGIAGYSFGAAIALTAAWQSNLAQAIVSIACPSRVFNEMGAREILQPKLLICGAHDHDFPVQQFRFLARRYSAPKSIEVIEGADHFFGGHVSLVTDMATVFFNQWLGESGG